MACTEIAVAAAKIVFPAPLEIVLQDNTDPKYDHTRGRLR